MDDDGDLHEQISQIEAQIDELTDIIERCRKIILISKTAIAAGGTVILAIIFGVIGFDPTVLIGAMAAIIGGTVVFGSNTSTLNQTMTAMKAAEAHRAELISRLHLRVVGEGGWASADRFLTECD
jgi:L-serine deaminase